MKKNYLLVFMLIPTLIFLCSCNLEMYFSGLDLSGGKPSLDIVAICEPQNYEFDKIEDYSEGLLLAVSNGKYGFVNEELQIVIPFEYELARSFYEGLAFVKKNGKQGFIDKSNNAVIPFLYDDVRFSGFFKDMAIVSMNKKWGIIKKDGSVLLPIEYDEILIENTTRRYLILKKDGRYGCFDRDAGKVNIEPMYDELSDFNDDIAKARLKNKYGCIDSNNNIRIPFEHSYMSDVKNNTVIVQKGDSYGVINANNKIIIPFKEVVTQHLGDNFIMRGQFSYYEESKISCYDTNGKLIIPEGEYEFIGEAYDDYILVCNEEKWGLVNGKGKVILPCEYDSITPFYYGTSIMEQNGRIAKVEKEGKIGFADKNGNVSMVEGDFNDKVTFMYGYAIDKNDSGKSGIIDIDGNIVFPYAYDTLFIRKNLIIVGLDGKYGVYKMIFDDDTVVSMGNSVVW